jgi:triacylglycerol esterase/lipase EstA (alpha/beta hydrolase family)
MIRLPRLVALISAVTALVTFTIAEPGAGAASSTPGSVPVVFVHGFYANKCPGLNVATAMAGPTAELKAAGWTGSLDVVAYYACDQGGTRIGSDTVDTPIGTIARQLANYIYATYTSRGQTVDIVAHSMGGLVARTALAFTKSKVRGFPPSLLVNRAVTFSTPFAGVGPSTIQAVPGLLGTRQATQVTTGSTLLERLAKDGAPSGSGGTSWLVIGSSGGCDVVPGASAVGLTGAVQLLYTGCWSHVQYLTDATKTRSYPAYLNGTAATAYGPLTLMYIFFALA